MEFSKTLASKVVLLGELVFQFGRTYRATYHEDGKTQESDTDHTVMLGITACAFASRFLPRLDVGEVAQVALVHDLVEVYAKDTPSLLVRTKEAGLEKKKREAAAFEKIKQQFDADFPWVVKTIRDYEELRTPEARFVKAFDKLMPKVSHLLNDGKYLREQGVSLDYLQGVHQEQQQEQYVKDFPEVINLDKALSSEIYKTIFAGE